MARFRDHFAGAHGHDRLSAVVRREVVTWRDHLNAAPAAGGLGLAPATVNTHLASLSGFTTWVCAHEPAALPHGNPCAKVTDLPLPALEPRALTAGQVRTLKNLLDRLPRFHQHKGRDDGMEGGCRVREWPWLQIEATPPIQGVTLVPRDTNNKEDEVMVEAPQRIERVQLGIRMEARLVKVLKGLAEFNDETLGELLEKIVLHSFEPVPGDEGESSASPHSKAALRAIEDLKKVYGLDYDTHRTRTFPKEPSAD